MIKSCRRKFRLAALLLLFSLLAVAPLCYGQERKIEGPTDIEADRLEYDQESDIYHAFGNVIVNFTNGFLVADYVSVNRKTGDAEATGEVYISDRGDTLEGDQVKFNLNTGTGVTFNGKAFLESNHVYITGSEIEKKGAQTYFVKDAAVTTCDADNPPWRFTARELDVTIEGYGKMKSGTFQVNNLPILYSPYMVFPAKTKRQSGFLLPSGMSYSDLNGFDMEIPFYWAISDNQDATFYQRYLEKRGVKEGLEYRYYASKDTYGTFYADYLKDSKEVTGADDGLFRDWKGDHQRWSYYWNHQQTFSPGFYIRTDLAKVSDPWYFRDFSNYSYYLQNYSPTGAPDFQKISYLADRSLASLDSTARLVKDWPLYNLTVLTRYTQTMASDNNDATLQYYPQATFTGIRRPIFNSPLNFELASSYLNAYRNEGVKGHTADVNPTFSLPLNFGDYLQLTPSLGLQETAWWASNGPERNDSSREIYTAQLYGTTEVHRIFDLGIGSIDKIRHGIKPEVTYLYRPNVEKNIPDFVTTLYETNALTYSLTNFLTARTKEKTGFSYLEFFRLKLTQTYFLKTGTLDPAAARAFSPISIESDVLPGKYFTLSTRSIWDPNDGEWKQLNHDFTINDDRGDTLSAQYRYTQDTLEEINLGLKAKVNKKVDLLYTIRQNLLDKRTLEAGYGIDYHEQCWSALLSYSELDNDRRVMIVFTLFGLGKVGSFEAKPAQLLGRTDNTAAPR